MSKFREDLNAVMRNDPAAKSRLEVILTYAGFAAVFWYRIAHFFYKKLRLKFIGRCISQLTRFFTGVEIHPGAEIAGGLFIDHGSGVVIGETAIVGRNVTIYQGVTLGGTGKDTGKRHPTVGDNVVISAGAKVLGNFTVGDNSKIGACSVVLKEVPPNATVVGIPGKVVRINGERVDVLDHTFPDPMAQEMGKIQQKFQELYIHISELENEIERLKTGGGKK